MDCRLARDRRELTAHMRGNEAEGTIIIYSFIEYICYDLKVIDVNH